MRTAERPHPHPAYDVLRTDQGRSLLWLADRTGFHPDTLSRCLRGIQTSSPRLRKSVSMALDVPVDELFHDDTAVAP